MELALSRRLGLLPRNVCVEIRVHQLIVQSEEDREEILVEALDLAPNPNNNPNPNLNPVAASASLNTNPSPSPYPQAGGAVPTALPLPPTATPTAVTLSSNPTTTPAPTPTLASNPKPSMLRLVADIARNATLKSARIRLTPVGRGGVKLTGREAWVSETPLRSGSGSGAGLGGERMFATWERHVSKAQGWGAGAGAGAGVGAGGYVEQNAAETEKQRRDKEQEEERAERERQASDSRDDFCSAATFGDTFHVSPQELDSILVTVKVASVLSGTFELGRLSLPIDTFLQVPAGGEEYLVLKVRRKMSGRVVGTVTCSLRWWRVEDAAGGAAGEGEGGGKG